MRTLILLTTTCFLLFSSLDLVAQEDLVVTDSIEANDYRTLDSLCECIQQRYQLLAEADLEELAEAKKGHWLKYVPNVGVTYDIQGKPRPAASINSSLLYTARRDRQQRQSRRTAILKRLQLEKAQTLAALRRSFRRYATERDRADQLAEIAVIDRELFYLYERQHENSDITPEEFLIKKRAFLIQEMRDREQQERVLQLRYEVEDQAGCLDLTR